MAQHMEQYRRYVVKKHPALLDEIVIWQNRY
jgi:hypothetical protein